MSKVVVFTSVTLDGVMQAPGRPDEDRRGGFTHGGWALPDNDPVISRPKQTDNPFTPLVLGSGRRLFPDGGASAALELVDSVPTTTGVIIATYRTADR
jgi:hypothetical protein